MPSGVGWLSLRKKAFCWLAGPMILALAAGGALYLSRPTVFVGRHWARSELPKEVQSVAQTKDVKVIYLDYDWSLNDRLSATPPMPPPE